MRDAASPGGPYAQRALAGGARQARVELTWFQASWGYFTWAMVRLSWRRTGRGLVAACACCNCRSQPRYAIESGGLAKKYGLTPKGSTRKPITPEPRGQPISTPFVLVIAIRRPRDPVPVFGAKSKCFYVLTALSLAGRQQESGRSEHLTDIS